MSEFLESVKKVAFDVESDGEDNVSSVDGYSSEEEEEDIERENHDKLMEGLSSSFAKRRLQLRSEPSTIVSEYNLSKSDGQKVNPDELLQGLTDKRGLKQLQQRLSKIKNNTTQLLKPLTNVQKDKIQRKLAYENASKQISDWDSIVRHNKEAEHLTFPFQEDIPDKPSLTTKIESFKAVTPLELAVKKLLDKSDCVIRDDEELSKAEKRTLLKMSIQEAKERRAELSKMRSLLSAYEHKQKRINRIKSKRFHKNLKKRKEKMEEAKKDNESEDMLEKAEKMRAHERATLKHSRMSKWTKDQLGRKHRDPSTRLALTEQARLKSEVKQKVIQESDDENDNDIIEEPNEDDDSDNDMTTSNRNNVWIASDRGTAGSTQGKSLTRQPSRSKTSNIIDPTDFFTIEKLTGGDILRSKENNLAAVQEAFADDDVIDEFIKEKQEHIEENKPKLTETTLPGWGEWGGQGVEIKTRKRKAPEEPAQPPPTRKDDHLKYVIINHTTDKKSSKHFVSELPYPYKDEGQLVRKLTTPIGRHWNTETTFNEMIKPRVKTKIGSIIEPMKRTDEVEKFMKKMKFDKNTSKNRTKRKSKI
jgi:U3 small nucleolar RNA-associated protein 14